MYLGQLNLFKCILVANVLLTGSLAVAKPKVDVSKKNFYFFKESFITKTYKVDSDGRKIQTNERIFFKAGDFINVKKDEKTGLLYAFINSDPRSREIVIIPQFTTKAGVALNGEEFHLRTDLVKQAREGDVNLLAKYLGEKGTKDAKFFYNGKSGGRIPITSQPDNDDFQYEDKDIGLSNCVALPSTDDELRVKDTKVVYTINPRTGEYSPRLYYFVETYYCRNGSSEECEAARTEKTYAQGWVAADRLTASKKEPSAVPVVVNPVLPSEKLHRETSEIKNAEIEKCEKPPVKKEIHQVSKVLESAGQNDHQEVLKQVGECFEKPYIDEIGKIRKDMARVCDEKYGKKWNHDLTVEKNRREEILSKAYFENRKKELKNFGPQQKYSPFKDTFERKWKDKLDREEKGSASVSRSSPTTEQLYAIDSLARTLFGEMRHCSGQSPAFYKAIARVTINRAAIVKQKGVKLPFYQNSAVPLKYQSLPRIIPEVVSEDLQYSTWNVSDPNLKAVLCPSRMEASSDGKQTWADAVKVASQAVLDTENFLEETKEITQTSYSSDMEPSWTYEISKDEKGNIVKKQLMKRHDAFRVGGTSYSEPECLILWEDEKNKKRIEELSKNPDNFALLNGTSEKGIF